ncbi:MAG: helix-turn-helix domain-containing protein [Gammaproteobacteria bacterium]|nr:helix-turn-helix domain-containing protein [Gammaproteobacteria bacterium]
MVKKSFSNMACSLARALGIIGEWWSMLIVRDFFLGNGVRRFEQLRDSLGISRNILTERLKTLTEAGVIERVPLREGGKRCAYKLTDQGVDLMPTMVAMMQWGEKWQSEPKQRLVVVREKATGDEIAPLCLRNQGGEPLSMRDLYLTAVGPHGEQVVKEWPPDWITDSDQLPASTLKH